LKWESKSFSDLVDIIGGGTPKTSIDEYWNGNIPWISIKDFNSDQKYVLNTEKTITEMGLNNSSTKLLNKNDIIISARGTVGEVAMIKYEMAFNQSCYGLKVHDLLDKDFVYYLLKYNINKLKNMVHGAVFDTITTNTFDNIIVNVPPREYQEKISYLLSNIDNLIEVKIHENNHLQNQIDILFKSFFINFDFYNGNYKETIFGNIPSEWNLCLFNDVLNERNEKSTNQEIPMFSVTLEGIQPRANIYNKKITAKTTKFKIIHKHDLIFGMPSSGYQYGVMYDEIGGVSSAYPVFEIKGIQPRYVDLFIKHTSNYFNDIVKSGSRMGQGIDKKVLLSKEIYIPPKEYLDKYYAIESNLVCMVNHNLNEINNLSKLRDTLLPKLMSGEIDVSKINYDLKKIIRKFILIILNYLWRRLYENKNYFKNTKSNETILKSRPIYKIDKLFIKFIRRCRYPR